MDFLNAITFRTATGQTIRWTREAGGFLNLHWWRGGGAVIRARRVHLDSCTDFHMDYEIALCPNCKEQRFPLERR